MQPTSPTSPDALSNHDLDHQLAETATHIDLIEHRFLSLIREFDRRGRHRDHQLASTAAWLGWRVGISQGAARERVRVANALADLPQIDAAFARGDVSYSKVRAMTRVATPENEARLLYMATQATAAQLERLCRGVEQVQRRVANKRGERSFRVEPAPDGMMRIELRVHADEAALVIQAIDHARAQHVSAEAPSDRVDGLLRVADAYMANAEGAGRSGGDRHHVIVCVQRDALMPGGVSAETQPTGAQVPPDTLMRLACDASITVVATDAAQQPLDVGRKTRTIPPAIRRALYLRDGTCRFPGCSNHRWLDAHHIEHWADGGTTRLANLVAVCPMHHQRLHEGGFAIRACEDGALTFHRPDGSLIERVPRPTRVATRRIEVRARRAPTTLHRPDYNLAIGVIVRPRANASAAPAEDRR